MFFATVTSYRSKYQTWFLSVYVLGTFVFLHDLSDTLFFFSRTVKPDATFCIFLVECINYSIWFLCTTSVIKFGTRSHNHEFIYLFWFLVSFINSLASYYIYPFFLVTYLILALIFIMHSFILLIFWVRWKSSWLN